MGTQICQNGDPNLIMCTKKRVIVLVFFFQGSITLPQRMNFGTGGSEVPSSKCVLFWFVLIHCWKTYPEMALLYQFHAQKALLKDPNFAIQISGLEMTPPWYFSENLSVYLNGFWLNSCSPQPLLFDVNDLMGKINRNGMPQPPHL